MCAIAGLVGDNQFADILPEMAKLLFHRGPDEEGQFHDHHHGVHLLHRRLSIVDLKSGQQPMVSACGRYVLVYNGEIYNHLELREQLEKEGAKFRTSHSDTETLLQGLIHWQEKCLLKLNGMWAFALWDKEKKELFMARDPFGQKPLFYAQRGEKLIFASELKALLLHPQIEKKINPLALAKYFAHDYVPAPLSLYQDVFALAAAHSVRFSLGAKTLSSPKRYWRYRPQGDMATFSGRSMDDIKQELMEKLDKAVSRTLMADVDLGVFLSGGIDSSCVTALALEHKKLETFAIGFEEKSFDESLFAKQVAHHLKASHHEKIMTIESALQMSDEILPALDIPLGDSSILPTALVCQFAKSKVKVAIGGDGGDEIFFGYDTFKAQKLGHSFQKIVPAFAHPLFEAISSMLPVSTSNMGMDFKVKRMLRAMKQQEEYWPSMWMSALDIDEINQLLGTHFSLPELFSEALEIYQNSHELDPYERLSCYYVELYLQNGVLQKVDRASMHYSLEVRAPLLDKELVDFACKLPSSYKFHQGQSKWILKEALKSKLPLSIISRPKKGFGVPVAQWFLQNKLQVKNSLDYLNKDFILQAQKAHLHQKQNHKAFLWNLLALEKFQTALL